MNGDEWDRKYQEQTDHIRALLTALDAGPAARRRRFRDLEIRCGRCGAMVAEVVALTPYRVLRFRGAGEDLGPDPGEVHERLRREGLTGMELGRRVALESRLRTENIRRGERRFLPLAWPRREDTDITIMAFALCECASWDVSAARLYDLLEAKTRQVVWHPQARDAM